MNLREELRRDFRKIAERTIDEAKRLNKLSGPAGTAEEDVDGDMHKAMLDVLRRPARVTCWGGGAPLATVRR